MQNISNIKIFPKMIYVLPLLKLSYRMCLDYLHINYQIFGLKFIHSISFPIRKDPNIYGERKVYFHDEVDQQSTD